MAIWQLVQSASRRVGRFFLDLVNGFNTLSISYTFLVSLVLLALIVILVNDLRRYELTTRTWEVLVFAATVSLCLLLALEWLCGRRSAIFRSTFPDIPIACFSFHLKRHWLLQRTLFLGLPLAIFYGYIHMVPLEMGVEMKQVCAADLLDTFLEGMPVVGRLMHWLMPAASFNNYMLTTSSPQVIINCHVAVTWEPHWSAVHYASSSTILLIAIFWLQKAPMILQSMAHLQLEEMTDALIGSFGLTLLSHLPLLLCTILLLMSRPVSIGKSFDFFPLMLFFFYLLMLAISLMEVNLVTSWASYRVYVFRQDYGPANKRAHFAVQTCECHYPAAHGGKYFCWAWGGVGPFFETIMETDYPHAQRVIFWTWDQVSLTVARYFAQHLSGVYCEAA